MHIIIVLKPIRDYRSDTDVRTHGLVTETKQYIIYIVHHLVFFLQGMLFCITIAYTNMDVMRVLCTKKSTFNNLNKFNGVKCIRNSGTAASNRKEEKGFTWIALTLCVLFVLCWIPQMVTYDNIFRYNRYKGYASRVICRYGSPLAVSEPMFMKILVKFLGFFRGKSRF